MKKLHFFAILLIAFVFLSACKKEEPALTLPPLQTETETVEKMSWYDFDLSEYMTMGDPMGVQAKFDDPEVCEEKEIDEALFQVMLAGASFEEKTGKAERYDKVKISFTMELEGVLQEKYSREEYEIVIGLDAQEDLEYLWTVSFTALIDADPDAFYSNAEKKLKNNLDEVDFYLTESGIVFYLSPGIIAPEETGAVSFEIKYEF